ncbi:DUF4212 domain-containing protein [Parvularcula oceani]|uniref:DUF4212 domain-containing protein n=1 Tax=Parvularcula oceani TaxID=1247963 RepID=UPI0004E20256|nr:DUF4212 domain-containing protein [Parvularcula oceani]
MEDASPDRSDGKPKRSYWSENLRLLGMLLSVWFTVSFGFGILLHEPLNRFEILGVPAGFWFAQAGSIYVFVALIFVYSWRISKIERRFGVSDDEEGRA